MRKSLSPASGLKHAVCAVWVQAGRLREPLLADLALLHDSSSLISSMILGIGLQRKCVLGLVLGSYTFNTYGLVPGPPSHKSGHI